MKKFAKSLIIIFFFGILPKHANADTVTHLRVGYLPILDHLTLLVSHAKDRCTYEQVEIEPKMFKAWREMVGALKAGVIDAAFILSPLAMDLFNNGVDIKTVLLAHRDGSAITVKTGSAIQSAAEFKGKAIAIPDRKATHTALLNKYLMGGGLSLKDVKAKVIAPPNMIKAMKLDKIDAFIVAEPFGAKAQHLGVGKILVLTKDIINHHVECIVVVNQQLIKNHRAAIQEWINSLIRAGKWIDQDKLKNGSKQVARLMTKKAKKAKKAKKYLPHSENIIIRGLQNPYDRISFSDLNPGLADFQTIMDISVQAGIIDKVNLEAFIDDSFYRNSPDK
jgi:NitT/TauT family transport system substrate-binding protein